MRIISLLILCIHLCLFAHLQGKECVIVTTPKTGTHLLHRLICEIENKNRFHDCYQYFPARRYCNRQTYERMLADGRYVPDVLNRVPILLSQWQAALDSCERHNQVCHRHSPYHPLLEQFLRTQGYVVFTLMRDPRDVAVSGAHFFFGPEGKQALKPPSWSRKMPMEARLKTMIKGTTWWDGMQWIYEAMDGWLTSPICCVIRFEKLLASTEEYGTEDQLEELRKIATCLELERSDEELLAALESVYGKSWTFRSGGSGEWRETFTPAVTELFKTELGDLLIRYGYESDTDW